MADINWISTGQSDHGLPVSSIPAAPNVREVQPRGDLEDFFENGAVPLHLVGADGIILRANKAELALLGYEVGEYVGRHIAQFHADQTTIQDILDRLAHGEQLRRYPARLKAKDGSIKHVEITSSGQFKNGRFINTRCFSFDVTDLRQAERAVREKESRLQQILDALPAAVYTTDADGKVTYFNAAAEQLAGRTPALGIDEWCVTWRLRDADGNPLKHEHCPMAVALKEKRPVRGVLAFAEKPDGTLVPFAPYPTPIYNEVGALTGAVNMLVDLTEQRKREAHIEFVMRELSHRSKNLLAIVQAVAALTIRNTSNYEEFQTKFMARMQTMARSHDLLVRNDWSGADIREIVVPEIASFTQGCAEHRVSIQGDSITLNPAVAQNVGLAIHELATNALKYGALSREDGRIEVRWAREEDGLRFGWKELNGNKPEATHKGFGTEMLHAFFKDVQFDFAKTGLQFSGIIPYSVYNSDEASTV